MPPRTRRKKSTNPQLCNADGEVLTDQQIGVLAENYVESKLRIKEIETELEVARQAHSLALSNLVGAGFREGMSIRYKHHTVVCVPTEVRSPQKVDPEACKKYSEQLVECGIAAWKITTPTKVQVNDNRGKLVAANVPIDEILPQPKVTFGSEIQIV